MPNLKMISKTFKPRIFEAREALEAGKYIKEGHLVIFPTETVMGIGANVLDSQAVERLSILKNRPPEKPFSYHFSSLSHFYTFAGEGLDARSKSYFEQWMPSALTLIYFDTIWQKKIGVRIPSHPLAIAMIEAAGVPVAAPSANFAGKEPPTTFRDLDPEFMARADAVLVPETDISEGVSSTIIDITVEPYLVLRQGNFMP